MKKSRKKYLHIPQHIMEITELNEGEKLLLAHIYSFGAKGCWQSNKTLGKIFNVVPRTIKRRLAQIRKFVYIRSPHSRLRTFLAKSHPDVRKMAIRTNAPRHLQGGQICPRSTGPHLSNTRVESCPTTGPEKVQQQGQNCPPTNTSTNTETNNSTPAMTPPAPWQGAASTPKPDEETRKRFEQIKARIKERRWKPIPQEEFERRKARFKQQLNAKDELRIYHEYRKNQQVNTPPPKAQQPPDNPNPPESDQDQIASAQAALQAGAPA